MKSGSGFSEGTIIWDVNARGLLMRVICCCRKDSVNVENLVPIPRSIRGRTSSSRIKVPAPTLVIIAVIVNYRRGYNNKKTKGRVVRLTMVCWR